MEGETPCEDGTDHIEHENGPIGDTAELSLVPLASEGTTIDWDALQIIETIDDEALPVYDHMPDESVIVYEKDNPEMKLGALFPSMVEFRLAMRQYAINKELELGIHKTDKTRCDGYCKGGEDCPWHIHARPERHGGDTIIVTVSNNEHTCTSSARRKTTTPSSSLVASKAVRVLGILQIWVLRSPAVVTRRRLAMLMGEGSSLQPMATSTPTTQLTPKEKTVKKMTPKRKKA